MKLHLFEIFMVHLTIVIIKEKKIFVNEKKLREIFHFQTCCTRKKQNTHTDFGCIALKSFRAWGFSRNKLILASLGFFGQIASNMDIETIFNHHDFPPPHSCHSHEKKSDTWDCFYEVKNVFKENHLSCILQTVILRLLLLRRIENGRNEMIRGGRSRRN